MKSRRLIESMNRNISRKDIQKEILGRFQHVEERDRAQPGNQADKDIERESIAQPPRMRCEQSF